MERLTEGSPGKVILKFTLPIFAGNILQQIYQMVDNMIVGQFVGANAFAAVGATYGIYFLICGLVWGITAGFSVPTAQMYGKGDEDGTRRTVGTALGLSAILTVFLTTVTVAGMPWLLDVMNTPTEIYEEARSYITMICAGLAAQILYNLLAAVLRAVGNSRVPLYFLILSCVLNIFLDLLFIVTFGLGVQGAALATVISQGVSGILCLGYIAAKVPCLHLTRKDFKIRRDLAVRELQVGIPMALQYAITSVGMMILQASLNLLGTMAVAAYSVGNKINIVMEQGPIAIGSAMATYCAQNLGAGNIKRIRQGVKAALGWMVLYYIILGTAAGFFGKYLTYLFLSDNVEVIIGNVDVFLKIVSATGILLGVLCVYRNSVQGMGYGVASLAGGVVELIARSIVAAVSLHCGTFLVVCMAYPAAWLFAAIFFAGMYRRVLKNPDIDLRHTEGVK